MKNKDISPPVTDGIVVRSYDSKLKNSTTTDRNINAKADIEPNPTRFINEEWTRVIEICESHPHSKVIANKYLKIIEDIGKGTLNPKMFPKNIDIVESVYKKVQNSF